ncbi:transglutaminase domain-containing protein [Herbiconiux sp. YIM B11900]|uniref:transglutaminase domain-containing protein n=1 Tax=Herbiconiux sp. YIM B11900 TaxID=3404131 RepID=UPI003F8516BD
MTGSNGGEPAGWYTDPCAPGPQKRAGKRRGLLIGLVSGGVAVAAVLALVATFVVVPAFTGGGEGTVYSDRSALYDFTESMPDLARDHEFVIDVDYDLEAENKARADEGDLDRGGNAPDWAYQVFYDAALTKPAEYSVFQLDPGGDVTVSGSEVGTASGGTEGFILDEAESSYGQWGLHDEYFLVSRLAEDGSERAKPLVTKFTVQSQLDAPDVSFGPAEEDGTVSLSWTPVEGAARYLVINHEVTVGGSGVYSIVAEVDGTEWSSAGDSESTEVAEAPFVTRQNVGLQSYNYRSQTEDDVAGGEVLPPEEAEIVAETIGFDVGVIATDGTSFSPFTPHDFTEATGFLPYEVAVNSTGALKKWGASGYIEGIENVQKVLPFTSVDGRTRSTVAYIDDSAVLDYGDRWILPLRGRNTQLGEWIPITKLSTPDPAAAIAQFNAEAQASAPATGMPRFDAFAPPENTDSEPVKEVPPTDYPVYGSTEFTRFLAGHLIAQTTSIDISDYVDAPGAPDPYDAIAEARAQNPYVFNVSYTGLRDGGDTMLVTYSLPTEEVAALQASLKQRVDEVVAAVAPEGMSDRDKVIALNDWLISNAEYDHEAFALLQSDSFDGTPVGYEYAWNATGTLLQGIGVCASYSYAFNALANAAGVQTVVVTGDVLAGGSHAWNKVSVDGQWLAVDTTWNDGGDPSAYLMIPDSGFTGDAERVQNSYWMIDSTIPAYATP